MLRESFDSGDAGTVADRHPFAMSSGGTAALHLPDALTARAFGPALLVAVMAHVGILLALLFSPTVEPAAEEPLARLVFVAPPPPPPAPLGVANGTGSVASVPEPQPVQPVVPKAPEAPKPVVADANRLRHVDTKAKPKPAPKPKPVALEPVAAAPAPVAPADVAPGVSTGSVGGEAGGVVGGVEGGHVGGVIGGTGTQPVPAGQVANPPQVIHRVAPVYPDAARRRGVKGLVMLEAILDREGRVEPAVKVLESIPMLDEEAIAAVRQWRFTPARNRAGDAVRVVLEIPIRFTLTQRP